MRHTWLLVIAVSVSGCASAIRSALLPLSGAELGSVGSTRPTPTGYFAAVSSGSLPVHIAALATETPDELKGDYAAVIKKCTATTSSYAIKSADALDHQNAIKELIATLTGLVTAGGGTVSATSGSHSASQGAGWVTIGAAATGVVLTFLVSPGDAGIKARNSHIAEIQQSESDLQTLLTKVGFDPAKWDSGTTTSFVTSLNTLDATCDVKL